MAAGGTRAVRPKASPQAEVSADAEGLAGAALAAKVQRMGKLDRRAGREGWLARPRHWALAAALAIFCVQAPPQAWAHDPSEPEADWYNSLKTANDGISCCSMSHDCGEVGDDYKPGAEPGSYWVWWRGGWAYVPPYAVLKRSDNPTGHPVACMHYLDGEPIARCFVRPTEG